MTTTTVPHKAAMVSVDDFGPFDALVRTDMRWNGWALPCFTLETVRQIADAIAAQNKIMDLHPTETVTITVDADGVWEHQGFDEDYTDPRGRKVEPITIDGVTYYEVGDGFCWSEWEEDGCSECGLIVPMDELTDQTRPGIDPAKVFVCRACMEAADA